MTTATVAKVLLRGPPRCKGDLFLELGEGIYACLRCGHQIPPVALMATARNDRLIANATTHQQDGTKKGVANVAA